MPLSERCGRFARVSSSLVMLVMSGSRFPSSARCCRPTLTGLGESGSTVFICMEEST